MASFLRTFVIFVFGVSAIAANAEMSPQDILLRFYQATGGSAWQRFEECDSAGTVALLQKTGTIRYIENLHSGGNRADIEISALDIKQANGDDLMQTWHQNAAGDLQLSPPDDPVSIDDRYVTSRGDLTVTYSARTLREHLNSAAFAVPFRKDYKMPPTGEVTVPADGGLTFQATINGKGPFKTLFDTGAVNFMSESFAHRLGLEMDTQGIEFGTSSPAKIQAHKARVDTLQIGDLVVHDQTFYTASLPEDDNVPVLVVGYELLRRFAVMMITSVKASPSTMVHVFTTTVPVPQCLSRFRGTATAYLSRLRLAKRPGALFSIRATSLASH
jgi:hypothetical protein